MAKAVGVGPWRGCGMLASRGAEGLREHVERFPEARIFLSIFILGAQMSYSLWVSFSIATMKGDVWLGFKADGS